jgi:hypothetical protein
MVHRLQAGLLSGASTNSAPSNSAPPKIEGDDAARDFRRELECDMPEQRSRERAPQTLALTYSLARLGPAVDAIENAREVEILDWSAHAATAFVVFDDAAAPSAFSNPENWKQAMDVRAIAAAAPPDEPEWPEWARALKGQFDQTRRLRVGPR